MSQIWQVKILKGLGNHTMLKKKKNSSNFMLRDVS